MTVTPTTTTVPPGDDEAIITPGDGGELKTKDNKVKIKFPKDAVTETVRVKYKSQKAPEQFQDKALAIQHVFDLDATGVGNKRVDQFLKPVTITVDLTSLIQFPLPRGQQLWLGYFDDKKKEWVRADYVLRKTEAGQLLLEAETTHFSTWGFGKTLDAGWLPVFNEPQVALFSGAATFNYPIEVPPGRGGVQPSLTLGYNSRQIDGMLTWTQSGWVGNGFDVDLAGITRDFTDSAATGDFAPGTLPFGAYASCEGRLRLQFNGTGYLLVPGFQTTTGYRYYTQQESNLYIERRNWALGDTTSANTTGEYWIVRDPSGMEYRMGFLALSELVLNHASRCLYASTDKTNVNYGGKDSSKVAVQWRVDQVQDLNGNRMDVSYTEEPRCGQGGAADKTSYINTISYNRKDDGTWGTVINFDRLDRPNGYDGHGACDKLTHQNQYLSAIRVNQNGSLVRKYEFGYEIQANSGGANTRLLNSIKEYGRDGASYLPLTTFIYSTGKANRGWDGRCANPNDPHWLPPPFGDGANYSYDCEIFNYKRLQEVQNGLGGRTVFTYTDDARGYYTFHNYRVTVREIYDGINATPARYEYGYANACYQQNLGSVYWGNVPGTSRDCPAPAPEKQDSQSLSGYGVVTATVKNYDSTVMAISVHYFKTNENATQLLGREYQTDTTDAAGTLLQRQTSTFTPVTTGSNRWTVQLTSGTSSQCNGSANCLSRQMDYAYDAAYPLNLLRTKDYGSPGTADDRTTAHFHINALMDPAAPAVVNPSFDGGLTGWSTFGNPPAASYNATVGYYGSSGVQMQGGTSGGVQQDVLGLTPGITYTVQVWVKATAGATAQFRIGLHDTLSQNIRESVTIVPPTTWTRLSVAYPANSTGKVRIHLYFIAGSGTVYADDVQLFSRWFPSLKWATNVYQNVSDNPVPQDLKTQTITYYDTHDGGAWGQANLITRAQVTMTGLGKWQTPPTTEP